MVLHPFCSASRSEMPLTSQKVPNLDGNNVLTGVNAHVEKRICLRAILKVEISYIKKNTFLDFRFVIKSGFIPACDVQWTLCTHINDDIQVC